MLGRKLCDGQKYPAFSNISHKIYPVFFLLDLDF